MVLLSLSLFFVVSLLKRFLVAIFNCNNKKSFESLVVGHFPQDSRTDVFD